MATITVNTTQDENNLDNGQTSVGEAIAQANNDQAADTIEFDASLAGGTITLSNEN